jgi:hypothetical protein
MPAQPCARSILPMKTSQCDYPVAAALVQGGWRVARIAGALVAMSAAQAAEPGASAPRLDLQLRRDAVRWIDGPRLPLATVRDASAQPERERDRERERERTQRADVAYGVGYEARMAARGAGVANPAAGAGRPAGGRARH